MGFIKLEVPAEGRTLASSPFHALEGASVSGAELLIWSPEWGAYTNLAGQAPGTGRGFWLVNAGATQAVVYLGGEVPLEPESAVALAPGMNLVGYPFLAVGTNLSLLSEALSAADGTRVEGFSPGEGYWYRHAEATPRLWLEARPYANPFATDTAGPRIGRLEVIEDGQAVRLTIHPASVTDALLDVYYQELMPGQAFTPQNGWRPAHRGLTSPSGRDVIWEDRGDALRPSPDTAFGRLYLAVRHAVADDTTGGDLPPGGDDPDSLLMAGGWETVPPGEGGLEGGLMGDAAGGVTNPAALAPLLAVSRVIYVDAQRGRDHYTGRAPVIVDAAHGPKQTIRAGLAAAQPGDFLVIRAGRYTENMNIQARDLKVRIDGRVNLSGPFWERPPSELWPPQHSTTNTAAETAANAGGIP